MSKFKFVQWYGDSCMPVDGRCSDVDITMPKGAKGDTGLSAYEFWKEKSDGTVDWPKDQTEVADFFKQCKGNDGKKYGRRKERFSTSGRIPSPMERLDNPYNPRQQACW